MSLLLSLSLILLSIHGACSNPCDASSLCGNIEVTYPFSLYDPLASHNQTLSYCGYPGLQIYCEDDKAPLLFLSKNNYTITDISYTRRIVSLVDTDILLQNRSNPIIRHNVSLTGHTSLNYTELVVNLTFFNNCTEFGPSYDPIILYPVSNTITKYSYIFPTAAIPAEYYNQWVAKCERIMVAPALGPAVSNNLLNLSATYGSVLLEGFQLEWNSSSEYCAGCEERGGQCGYNATSNSTYIPTCFCDHGSCGKAKATIWKRSPLVTKAILIGIAGASIFIVTCLIFISKNQRCKSCVEYIFSRKCRPQGNIEMLLEKYGSLTPKRYKYGEVKKITRSFRDTLGKGGFGTVYKGSLQDGRMVAVKILHNSTSNGDEFLNEVISIGRTSHVNVVSLFGFCIEGKKHALIYEYMPNGSLDNYIYSEKPKTVLGWEKLYGIAIGIARGLEYLHRGCNARIVHFDIKPQNILLDEKFTPKIADFGLAKLCSREDSILSMAEMRGTIGFIAPEVFSRSFGVISAKSDVYSYGMMLLEMVGGRRNAKQSVENPSQVYFPHWLYDRLVKGSQIQTCDVEPETEEVARKMGIVGLWCTQTMPDHRPSMSTVVEMLEKGFNELDMPPKPYLSSPSHTRILSNSFSTLS